MTLMILLSACANVSRFEKDILVAHGEPFDGAKEPIYYSIFIDGSHHAEKRILSALVKLSPNTPALPVSELKPDIVSKYLPKFIPPQNWPENLKNEASEYDAYSGGGFHINFKEGAFISLGICSHCSGNREHPIVGTPDGKTFYTLPLTKQQLMAVFGKPDRVYKVSEIRY